MGNQLSTTGPTVCGMSISGHELDTTARKTAIRKGVSTSHDPPIGLYNLDTSWYAGVYGGGEMSATRYEEVGGYANYEGEWVEPTLVEKPKGWLVHYSDYEKLVEALRHILRFSSNISSAGEIAEAALLSNGEEL